MSDPFEPVYRKIYALPAFFIGGLPRSGTTWVQQLLNAHPEVLCLGESRYADDMVPAYYQAVKRYAKLLHDQEFWAPSVVSPESEHTGPLFRTAFATLAAVNLGDKEIDRLRVVGEKTPENIGALQRLWSIFPDGRFIHVIRDPRDGAISGFLRFRSKLPEHLDRKTYVYKYASDWQSRIEAVRKVAGDNPNYREIRYEDLQTDPEKYAAGLFTFLGASADPDMVRAATDAASFEKLSGGRKQGEEDANSHYRLGKAGAWKTVLTPEEQEIAERYAGPLMKQLGYL